MSNKDSRKSGREKTVRAAKIDTYISDYFMSTLADKLIQRSRSNVFHLEGDGKMIEKIDAESLYEKGVQYYDGKGVPVDKEKALLLFEQAAQQGHVEAQVIVGSLYERGDGTDVDYQKALYWYEKAAEQGHDHGVVACASMYREGKGTPVDLEKARYWADRIASD